ncbi:trimeric intracellular cation channel family protein [Corynebacterium lizhenjunii]|uniref:trimeric intracellular cation channel family protein n=1 Tax=Corynebacterium lizhenjunii TaxID=2709394 RepID=UPI0013E9EA1E|nr:trimeric intracellular cation channel family protein [Corynebacterium lizhenjunii]
MTVMDVDPLIETLYRWSDVSGVLLMGIIGGTIARQRGYDIIGFFFIAMFSALGGGMIRDVLINRGTVAAMSEPEYLYLAFTGALIARFVYFKGRTWELFHTHGDAVVSGLWAATGAVKALTYGLPPVPCIMMGVFTATGGSMIRDVSMGREPAVFGDNLPTVIPAIACSVTVLVSQHFDALAWGMLIGPVISIVITLTAYWTGWRVRTDADWAPINDTAVQMAVMARRAEQRGRAVGRRLEPTKVRSWRHRQMEKALQRRIEKEVRAGKRRAQAVADASQFMDSFRSEMSQMDQHVTGQFPAVKPNGQQAPSATDSEWGFGVDVRGDSYEDYAPQESHSEGPDHNDVLDMILSDESLADEFVDELSKKFEQRDD